MDCVVKKQGVFYLQCACSFGGGGGQCSLSVVVEGPEVKGYGDWGGVEYKNGCQKEVHYFPWFLS